VCERIRTDGGRPPSRFSNSRTHGRGFYERRGSRRRGLVSTVGLPNLLHPVTAGVTAVLLRRLQRRPLRAARRAVCRFPRWIGGFKACQSLAPQSGVLDAGAQIIIIQRRRLWAPAQGEWGRDAEGRGRISHQSTMRTAVDPPPPSLHLYFEGAVARNRRRNPHGTAAAPAGPVGASRRSFSTM